MPEVANHKKGLNQDILRKIVSKPDENKEEKSPETVR
jgi:hypothetical protein